MDTADLKRVPGPQYVFLKAVEALWLHLSHPTALNTPRIHQPTSRKPENHVGVPDSSGFARAVDGKRTSMRTALVFQLPPSFIQLAKKWIFLATHTAWNPNIKRMLQAVVGSLIVQGVG